MEKTGLDCKNNQICSLGSGRKIKIKQDENTSGEIDNLPTSPGKLKLQNNVDGYNQNLKFIVEEGDVTLSNTGNVTKMERDETYEITEEEGKWLLVRKSTALEEINKKLENLGLPVGCRFEANSDDKDCGKLDVDDKLKKINFDEKNNSEVTVTNADGVTLKLEKNSDREVFPGGIKIIFENNKEVTINKEGNTQLLNWKNGTNPEYKIEGGKLKRAWNVIKLAKKAGLNCTNNNSTIECTFGNKVNVYESSNKWITDTKVDGTSVKVTVARGQNNYNQGFKFTVSGTDFALTGGTPKTGGESFTTIDTGASYEIKEQNVNGGKKWFLSKKN